MLDGGLKADPDRGFEVIFRGKKVGIFIPDLIVDDVVIVELNDQPSCNPGPPPGTMEPSQKTMSIGHHFSLPLLQGQVKRPRIIKLSSHRQKNSSPFMERFF